MKLKLCVFLLALFAFNEAMAETCEEIHRSKGGIIQITKCLIGGQVCIINGNAGGVDCFPKKSIN